MRKLITSPMKKLRKSLFKSRKTRSLTRSEESEPSSSFSSSSTSNNGCATPTSVLTPPSSAEAAYCELKQAFRLIDSDGDGKISKLELRSFLSVLGGESIGEDDDDLTLMVDEADSDGDGCIDLEEFCLAIGSAFAPPACDAEVRETFDFFDSDGDGKITAEELYQVFRALNGDKCTLEECEKMINGVDRNGDGVVCFEDFRTMMDIAG